jgi:xylulose-5-phosphate/fructose-6-phosphate phosphoketolase
MTLFSPEEHPHGMSDARFRELFTDDVDVVFAFHGYAGAVHQLLHGRPKPERFHVRGYVEEGTTTTPFDMVVLNGMSRFHLAAEALRRAAGVTDVDLHLAKCKEMLDQHHRYVLEHFEDLPEIRDWTWPG